MDSQENENRLILEASWKAKAFSAAFTLVYLPTRNLPIPPFAHLAMRVLITLFGLAMMFGMVQDFRKGLKMGMSEKGGSKLTVTVWALIVLILLLLYFLWLPILSS